MSHSEYNSTEFIKQTRDRINGILYPLGNEVYVFDFGHYILKDPEKHSFYFKSVIFGSESYKNQLFPNDRIKTDTDTYTYFESNFKQIINIPLSEVFSKDEDRILEKAFPLGPEIISTKLEFETKQWVNILNKIKVNGCLFVYAKKVGNYQSGVWLVLKNRIDAFGDELICLGFKNDCTSCQEQNKNRKCTYKVSVYFDDKKGIKQAIDEVFQELDNLLINELVFNAGEYAKKIEVEKLALKKFQEEILEVHAHTIKNCFPDIESMKNKIERLIPWVEYDKIKDIIEEENIVNDELIHIITRITKTNNERSYNVIEILDFLRKHVKPSEADFVPTIFEGEKDITNNCKITVEQEDNAFTLFWNLWKNCKTASKSKIPFQVYLKNNVNSELEVSFINEAPNIDHIQNVLKIINSSVLPNKEPKGLNIVRYKAYELGWCIIANYINNQLIITVTTKNQ